MTALTLILAGFALGLIVGVLAVQAAKYVVLAVPLLALVALVVIWRRRRRPRDYFSNT